MKKILFLLLGVSAIAITSCKRDFEETNTNTNVPNEVTPDLLLSGIIRNTLNDQVGEAWGIGNIVVQHHAKIQFVNEDRYLWGERSGLWSSMYGNMRNVQNMLVSVGDDNTNAYKAVALVMKSWMFATLTDAYGDVPYTEATKGKTEAIYTPKYDKQEDIYAGILTDLATANTILAASVTNLQGDILYGGGTAALLKWRKLANSLRVRYLVRLSKRKDVSAALQAIVNDAAGNPLFTSNADNAELKYFAAAPNQWPLYGSRVGSFDEFRLSKTLGDRLEALHDTRLPLFARPTQSSVAGGTPEIKGIPNGLGDVAALNYNGGPQGVSRVGYTFACLVCNDAGQAPPIPDAPRALLMTYAELQFLLAEARERGWIATSTAETYYLAGINANFNYWNNVVPSSYNIDVMPPPSYFTQDGVTYTGTQPEKLAKIALQKWIALYFNGLEAWFDWRRTGLPTITPGPDNLNNNRVPVRYPYPLSEQSVNAANRAEAVQRQGADDINTRPWVAQ